MKVIVKVMMFVSVVVATHLTIQAIKARQAVAQTSSDPPTFALYGDGFDITTDPDYQNSAPASFNTNAIRVPHASANSPKAVVTSVSIPEFETSVQNGVASVEANALMIGGDSKTRYIWRLRVYTVNDKVFANRLYADQAFTIGGSGEHRPNFADDIAVPVGESRVVLSLYGLTKIDDSKVLNDDAKAAGYVVARLAQNVVYHQ